MNRDDRYSAAIFSKSRLRSAFGVLVMALMLLPGLAADPAEARTAAPLPPPIERPAPATEPRGAEPPLAPGERVINLKFKDIGAIDPIQLRGIDGAMSLRFPIRSDEVVVSARLRLDYAYSPALLEELSHLKVMLNDEVAGLVPLPKGKELDNHRELNLNPLLFTDYNRLTFRLIGHYTYRCEDPMHSSLWLNLSNNGSLELRVMPFALANDLKLLPTPFFDVRDNRLLELPFVFADAPSEGTLRAAGVVASWFGGLASYRGARFPAQLGSIPAGNAVVFVRGNASISGLPAVEAGGAGLAVETHPLNPNAKLLIVSGATDDDLMRAARALVFADPALSGQRVGITHDVEPPPRKPYDAPAWVPIDRPVRFGELATLPDLQAKGYFPDVIRVNFRVSPDLFTWRSLGVPMELKYRFTRLPFSKNASLNVNINRNFIQAFSLHEPGKTLTLKGNMNLPLLEGDVSLRDDQLFVPPYQIGGRNQLQLHYYFDVVKEGECRDGLPDNLQGAVDPESTIDFSQFPHYAALPNLAYFANIGFPFTRMADLAETAVVLPNTPNTLELSTYLGLMGRMGEATGYPVLRHALVLGGAVESVANRDLLVIGNGERQPLMAKWADRLPLVQVGNERRLREPDLWRRALYRWEEKDLGKNVRPEGMTQLRGVGSLAALMAFESPLTPGRSVVYLHADQPDDLAQIAEALNDPVRVAAIQGDFVVVDGKSVEHYKSGETYYVGSLPWLTQARWIFSQYPVLLSLLGILISLLIAVFLYRNLRRIARARLASSQKKD